MPSEEIKAMGAIEDVLGKIKDEETCQRIVKWAVDKYGLGDISILGSGSGIPNQIQQKPVQPNPPKTPNEIPGIATHNKQDSSMKFTIRDLKAKNAKNAAVRLALVSTYIYEKFTGETTAPRQRILTPLLKDYRINRGSSRAAIIDHKGIIAVGRNNIQLDSHAKIEAENIIAEILSDDVEGGWSPTNVRKYKANAKKKAAKKTVKQ